MAACSEVNTHRVSAKVDVIGVRNVEEIEPFSRTLPKFFLLSSTPYSSHDIDGAAMLGDPLQRIRSIADYQFGRGAGEMLFPDNVDISFSRGTGRIRHIYLRDQLLATLRPTDGMFSLTITGARRLVQISPPRLWVKVTDEAAVFIIEGKSVFAKHVVDCDEQIRPEEEVIVVNSDCKVLAVGRATLTGEEMKKFGRGVAVRVRHGAAEEKGKLRRANKENKGKVVA